MTKQRTFSSILSHAISQSGLSLTDIVNELDKQGLTLSAASLSYWKTGKSLPTRKSSRPILDAIEKMCSLSPGTLIEAAQSDSNANRNRQIFTTPNRARTPDNRSSQVPSESEELDEEVQWEYEAEREILVDSHRISADFMNIQSEVMILARVTSSSRSHLHVSSYLNEDENEFADTETGLRYLEGATIGETIRHEGSRAITLRLDLPAEGKSGELHRVFYLPTPFSYPTPCTQTPNRYFAWPLNMYNCSVVFEGDVPKNIEWVTEATQEQGDSRIKQTRTQRITPDGQTVQVTMEKSQGMMGYFRWT